MNTEEKLAVEKQFADEQISTENQHTVARWEGTKAGFRMMIYRGKTIMAYQLMFGKPIVKNIFTCRDVVLDLTQGLISEWSDQYGTVRFIGHQPKEIAPSCFLWHNKLTHLEYTNRKGKYEMRMPMTWRTQHHPRIFEDGAFYLLEKSAFQDFKWESQA